MVKSTRYEWIDYSKALMLLLVIVGHVFLGLYESNKFQSDSTWIWIVVQVLYTIHIPVFFALSGYFFKPINSFSEYGNYVKNKTISLGLPYIFYNILHFSLQQVGGASVRDKSNIYDLINIYREPVSVSWYLYILWGVFVLVGFISLFVKSKYQLLGITFILMIFINIFNTDIYIIQRTLLWSFFFVLGYVLRYVNLDVIRNWKVIALLLLSHILYIFTWFKYDFEDRISYHLPQWWALIFVISIVWAFLLIPKINTKSKFMLNLGRDSLVIYLLHAPVVSFVRIILLKLGIDSAEIHIIVGSILGLVVPLLANYIIKRVKYFEFIFYPLKYIKK